MNKAPFESEKLADWLAWLEQLDPSRIEFGLERIKLVYQRLMQLSENCLADQTKIVTIAGTNGKGSCVAALQSCALVLGKRVVSFSSPHLLRYNERIQIQGNSVSDRQLVAAFQLIAQAQEGTFLTYFEYGALAALLVAATENPDLLILEVGLGGRLDAVNMIDADIVVLTAIGMDHMDWLGDDLESIAAEKCGVIRRGIPLVLAAPDMPERVYRVAEEMAANLYTWGEAFEISSGSQGPRLRVGEQATELGELQLHPQSCAAAAMVCELLWHNQNKDKDDERLAIVARALSSAQLGGRLERRRIGSREVLLDVAHNPMSLNYLRQKLEILGITKVDLLFAIMDDKDAQAAIDILAPLVERWQLLRLKADRAATPETLLDLLKRSGISNTDIVELQSEPEWQKVIIGENNQIPLLVTGSFYTVSAILERASGLS